MSVPNKLLAFYDGMVWVWFSFLGKINPKRQTLMSSVMISLVAHI